MVCAMTADLVISYDGTSNDDDALVLGRLLAQTGSAVALAYVRHSREFDPRREEVAQHDAEQRLERGAAQMDGSVARYVEVGAATGDVLGELAQRVGASIIVFGSDYRTPVGRAEPGTSAQRLLEGGRIAVGVAAAGLRAKPDLAIRSIAVPFAGPVNDDARATAAALAARLGAHGGGREHRTGGSDRGRLHRWRAERSRGRRRRGPQRAEQRSQFCARAPC